MGRGLDGFSFLGCGSEALAAVFKGRGATRSRQVSGGHGEGETPLPIPNRAVKPLSADGTWTSRSRESRTPPVFSRHLGDVWTPLAASSGVRCAEHYRTPLRPCQRRPAVPDMTRNNVDIHSLPADLPVPSDDGAADHLVGARVPSVALRATSGPDIDLASAASGLVVVYVYPRTGEPGRALPEGWDEIPGARGCTLQNCVFRDHAAALQELGALVYGVGAQPLEEQRSFVAREAMPYPLLNDSELQLAEALGLPTFEAGGMRLYRRLTFVASAGRIERVVYPVFPPGSDAEVVLAWLRERPRTRTADSRPGSGSRL